MPNRHHVQRGPHGVIIFAVALSMVSLLAIPAVVVESFHLPVADFTARVEKCHNRHSPVLRSVILSKIEMVNYQRGEKTKSLSMTPMQSSSSRNSDRRHMLATTVRAISLLPLIATTTATTSLALAANGETTPTLLQNFLSQLRRVPVFAIVEETTGKPFYIFGESAPKASGYFFTTYDGAKAVLDGAKKKTKAEEGGTVDTTWDEARVIVVPLDFAMKVFVKHPKAMAQNGNPFDTVYDIIPGVEAVEDAQKLDSSGIYTVRGRVPLFYIDDLELEAPASSDGGGEASGTGDKSFPVYFSKSDLLKEWNRQFTVPPPQIKVVELIDTFQSVLANKPGNNKITRVKNLVFVPSEESKKAALECKPLQGVTGQSYKLNEMILVGGK